MNVVECTQLSKSYGNKKALNNISFHIRENSITGLIGRNGAGKTTLLKLLAGLSRETSGEVKVFSERPFNNLKVSMNTIFVDEDINLPDSLNLTEILEEMKRFYPNWDMDLANRLFSYFSFHPKQKYDSLSKGMRSTYNMIIGLSARCALTIFDEPTTGMDSAARKDFYKALLKDYLDHPRTIIISNHHLHEMEAVLEDILLIKNGRNYLHMLVAELKELAIGIKGKEETINRWTENSEIFYRKRIGTNSEYLAVKNEWSEAELQRAKIEGLDFTAVDLADLCEYLTDEAKGGIDDVFSKR
ncbi:ABC transporter ATP-binding protein [Bacillus gobiensis]|uniref:ABC transporter ATP-binding protein n=1 Tax=Bacillus gobiensis TaxID=1441095 RepID=UPI003D1C8422